MRKVVVITGQTGTGKTGYALNVAKKKNGELINADSRQVYKYLDIITGKDLDNDSIFNDQFSMNSFNIGFHILKGIKIWLYDVVDPKQPFSSYDFKELANRVIDDIISRGKTPIIVGGSYLYIKHLLYGFETETIPPDWELREKLNNKTVEELQIELNKIDKNRFEKMNNSDRNNPRRLIRQIEIGQNYLRLQGKSTPGVVQVPHFCHPEFISGSRNKFGMTDEMPKQVRHDNKKVDFIGFRFEDNYRLAEVIKKRVEERVKQGAFEEVEKLLKMGYTKLDPGLNTIGYKEIIAYLEGKCTKQQVIDRWILSEIQYAKRQYTFMKKDENIEWKEVT